jgi:hypothetical protein
MPGAKDEASRSRERLRMRFRPARVRLLFVGESPPASGRFFYRSDSGLYRAMREAFLAVDPAISDATFLGAFQASGSYLIDLCREPVDQLDSRSRRAACEAGEGSLSRAIARLEPSKIVTVVRSIEANVRRAALRAGWRGPLLHLPYPGRWARHKEVFVAELARYLSWASDERGKSPTGWPSAPTGSTSCDGNLRSD